MRHSCLTLFTSSLLLVVSSCSSIPDTRFCVEITPIKAKCVKMVSGIKEDWDDEHLLYGKQYWESKYLMIRIHPDEVANLKAFFLKQCKRNNSCHEVENQIKFLDENLIIH